MSMNTQRWGWSLAAGLALLSIGTLAVLPHINRLSGASLLGRWRGYAVTRRGVLRNGAVQIVPGPSWRVPQTVDFRPDGVYCEGVADETFPVANYRTDGSAITFYDWRDPQWHHGPVRQEARLAGDTLTMSAHGHVVGVLHRVR